jgi:MFS family permease
LAFVLAAIVTGVVISGRSPDALFVFFVPLLVITGLAAWRLFAPAPDERAAIARARRVTPSMSGFVAILRRPGLLALLVGTTLIWTAVGAVMTFIAIRVTSMGADLGIVGLMSAVGSAIEVPIMLAFPLLTRRFSAERQLVLGALAFALRSALWAIAPTPLVALLVAPLGGIGFALFYVGIVTVVAKSVPAEVQATAQGLYSGMTFSLGSVVGAVLGGAAAPLLGLPGMFAAAAVAGSVGAVVVARAVATAAAARKAQAPVAAAVPS